MGPLHATVGSEARRAESDDDGDSRHAEPDDGGDVRHADPGDGREARRAEPDDGDGIRSPGPRDGPATPSPRSVSSPGGPITAFLMHPYSSIHDTGWGHPEHQGRLRALARALDRDMLALHGKIEPLEADVARLEDALAVHSEAHLATVRSAVELATRTGKIVNLDADTRVSAGSWKATMGALGAAIAGVRVVARGSYRNAFVATRPPGHHATPERAMGFCLVNHVACAARSLQARGHAKRVLIVDWDVHHGNGTEEVFRSDPTVFYLSVHQSPHYPGTGRESDRGEGAGEGFTRNVELPAGTSRGEYLERFRCALDDVVERFPPDFVLVSSGFDCLAGDPLGRLLMEPEDLHRMTRTVMERVAGGGPEDEKSVGVVVCLEGGYDPERTGRGAVAVIRALAGLPPDEHQPGSPKS